MLQKLYSKNIMALILLVLLTSCSNEIRIHVLRVNGKVVFTFSKNTLLGESTTAARCLLFAKVTDPSHNTIWEVSRVSRTDFKCLDVNQLALGQSLTGYDYFLENKSSNVSGSYRVDVMAANGSGDSDFIL